MARVGDWKKLRRCRLILPPTHNSDHCAMVVRLAGEEVKQYRNGRKKSRMTEGEKMFESLARAVDRPSRRERDTNSWIWRGTWVLVDQRTSLRREGRLS